MNRPEQDSGQFRQHLESVMARTDAALARTGYDQLVVFSGSERLKLFDDAPYPFVANPQFKAWLPLTSHPDCFLIYRPGSVPQLVFYQPEDYWYMPPAAPSGAWTSFFEICPVTDPTRGLSLLPQKGRIAVLGEFSNPELVPAAGDLNPPTLLNYLDYHRAWKTPYEIACMRAANDVAVRAHQAAETAFREGESEFAIHLAYCLAAGQDENELPYASIVALNRHGAVLHYQNREHQAPSPGDRLSFLIDAGASCNGYAADITRSYSASDAAFSDLIDAMDAAQQRLCAMLRPGVDYRDVHLAAHREVAALLVDGEFLDLDADAAFESGITRSFFPHGVGHYIGLQVHDVGGFLADESGATLPRPDGHPFLRLTREVDAGHVMTIEPGIYFIDSLLDALRASDAGRHVNWERVAHFSRFGGIRIEDDVAVTATGHENLTREAFARALRS